MVWLGVHVTREPQQEAIVFVGFNLLQVYFLRGIVDSKQRTMDHDRIDNCNQSLSQHNFYIPVSS